MRVKTIVDEDFTNYKKPAMFIGTISCGGKCCIEAGIPLSVCQNDGWRSCAPITIDDNELCHRYLTNPLTKAVVFGGLEPMEQFEELLTFLDLFRDTYDCEDDVVIYTGYYPEEIPDQLHTLSLYENVFVKFGRYIPNKPHRFDPVHFDGNILELTKELTALNMTPEDVYNGKVCMSNDVLIQNFGMICKQTATSKWYNDADAIKNITIPKTGDAPLNALFIALVTLVTTGAAICFSCRFKQKKD